MYIEVLLHYSLVTISLRYYLIRSKEKVCMRAYLQLCHPKMSRMVRVLYDQFRIRIITTVNITQNCHDCASISSIIFICNLYIYYFNFL